MNDYPKDERSNLAKGMDWASRIFTACLSMVLPSVAGHYADQHLGTGIIFLMVGLLLGMFLGIYQLIRLAAAANSSFKKKRDDDPKQPGTRN